MAVEITYKTHGYKEHMGKLVYPKFMKGLKHHDDFMNWMYSALAFFVASTVEQRQTNYTWVELPVPDAFIELIGCNKLIFDYSDEKNIYVVRNWKELAHRAI